MPDFELKPFQKLAIGKIRKRAPSHVLCIAPTGSGKSLIYEKIIEEEKFRTLLVTPLVALARQQLRTLESRKVPTQFNGTPHPKTKVWIVSPEKLTQSSTRQTLADWRPEFLVVDECHCMWEWGDGFRPAFTRIPPLLKDHSIRRSLWLTATLPKGAQQELFSALPKSAAKIGEFDLPPNLRVDVQQIPWPRRLDFLLNWILLQDKPGIIFAGTREVSERLCRLIQSLGRSAVHYHAGISHEERRSVEKSVEDRRYEIVVATSAFGMGMNYPHLQWVVLWQAPHSILELAQAIGRVGRDSKVPAKALILWDHDDFRLLEWGILKSERRRQDLESLSLFLKNPGCRRWGLKLFFEEPDPKPPQKGCSLCDFCEKN